MPQIANPWFLPMLKIAVSAITPHSRNDRQGVYHEEADKVVYGVVSGRSSFSPFGTIDAKFPGIHLF
jgi:hypothetical protein